MQRLKKKKYGECGRPVMRFAGWQTSVLFVLLVATMALSSCGGGGGSSASLAVQSAALSGNWQFTMTPPTDNSFVGGLQGGFLLQEGNVHGGIVYSVALPAQTTPCSSGSAGVSGTMSGQQVTLTAVAGVQTFTLTGMLSSDGTTMSGTYDATDGQGCGTAQTGLAWSAIAVKPLTGKIQGTFHSTSGGALLNRDFPVTGYLTQGENIGASNATVTGTLNFNLDYPCLSVASVNGQISGSSVILQIISSSGLNSGQIGAPAGFAHPSPVLFESTAAGGYILHGTDGYGVSTTRCPGPGALPGDGGNICLGLGSESSCLQPLTMTPAAITFPLQQLGSNPAQQIVTLTNTDPAGATLSNLSLTLQVQPSSFSGYSDFNGVPNYTEQDNCASAPGASFDLAPQQSCSISIFFTPQQSCPWLPLTANGGIPPVQCPYPLTAKVVINSPKSADGDTTFVVPITGLALSSIVSSTPELDFGSEALTQVSAPQTVSFLNQGVNPVEILPSFSGPCANPLPRPLIPGVVVGVQVVISAVADITTIDYLCDVDLVSQQPNFQISADTCTGATLAPQESCSLQVAFAPQPGTPATPAPDYSLQLNTLECTSNTTMNCEIDAGRFPVELKANVPSPLRMTPGAGLDFGYQEINQPLAYPPLKITLFNDPADPNSSTVNFTGNLVKGPFLEKDDCGGSLAPGGTCTLSIYFQPTAVGFATGTVTVTYAVGQTQTIYMRGWGCQNCLPIPGTKKARRK